MLHNVNLTRDIVIQPRTMRCYTRLIYETEPVMRSGSQVIRMYIFVSVHGVSIIVPSDIYFGRGA